jgi:hypothetical protein
VIEQSIARARGGDEGAFRELTDPYRREPSAIVEEAAHPAV